MGWLASLSVNPSSIWDCSSFLIHSLSPSPSVQCSVCYFTGPWNIWGIKELHFLTTPWADANYLPVSSGLYCVWTVPYWFLCLYFLSPHHFIFDLPLSFKTHLWFHHRKSSSPSLTSSSMTEEFYNFSVYVQGWQTTPPEPNLSKPGSVSEDPILLRIASECLP